MSGQRLSHSSSFRRPRRRHRATNGTLDVGGAALVEAWDLNNSREWLAGVAAGVENRLWRTLRLRLEGWVVRALQESADGWVRGFDVGPRWRWGTGRARPFADLSVGLSDSTIEVPPRGTRFNFVARAGGGVQVSLGGRASLDVGARWLHLSNNGREGRQRNPDIQSLGAVVAVGWSYLKPVH